MTRSPASGRLGDGAGLPAGSRRRSLARRARENVVVLAGLGRAVAEADARPVDLAEPARQPAVHARCDLGVDERAARLEVGAGEHLGDVEDRRDRDAARLALGRDRVLRHAGEAGRRRAGGARRTPRAAPGSCRSARPGRPRARRATPASPATGAAPARRRGRGRRRTGRSGTAQPPAARGSTGGPRRGSPRRCRGRGPWSASPPRGRRSRRDPRDRSRGGSSTRRASPRRPGSRSSRMPSRVARAAGRARPARTGSGCRSSPRGPSRWLPSRGTSPVWPKSVIDVITSSRVARQHVVGAEPERRERAGPRRLDPHVRRLEQRQQALAVGRRREVERDAALVRVADGEEEARSRRGAAAARRERAPPGGSTRMTSAPEVGEEAAARLALLVGHVDDAQRRRAARGDVASTGFQSVPADISSVPLRLPGGPARRDRRAARR